MDIGLVLLRLMVGVVFVTGGWNHLKDPSERSTDIGMNKGFTLFLGAAELAGGLGVAFGVLTQLAAMPSREKFLCGTQTSGARTPPAGITTCSL